MNPSNVNKPQIKNNSLSFLSGYTMPKPGDEYGIPEFLRRLYVNKSNLITKVNLIVFQSGHLSNDLNYHIYKAKVEIEEGDRLIAIDWVRKMNSPSDIASGIEYLLNTAIICGLIDKVYINNNKVKSAVNLIPLTIKQMPMIRYSLIDDKYQEVFK